MAHRICGLAGLKFPNRRNQRKRHHLSAPMPAPALFFRQSLIIDNVPGRWVHLDHVYLRLKSVARFVRITCIPLTVAAAPNASVCSIPLEPPEGESTVAILVKRIGQFALGISRVCDLIAFARDPEGWVRRKEARPDFRALKMLK